MLPLRVKFATISDVPSHLREELRGAKGIARYADLIEGAAEEVFSVRSFRRTHCLTITYLSQSGGSHLELVLTDSSAEWHVFVHAPGELAANDRLRAALQQPVAKCRLSESLFGSAWSWRVPHTRKASISIKGHGVDVPTWWARNEMPDFRNHKQPQYITVKCDENSPPKLRASIDGTYQYLPRCGTACDSLYKRLDDRVFLFLDPTRVGDPNQDCFVFSDNTTRLDYGEIRSPIAHIEAVWRPWNHGQGEHMVSVVLDADWIETCNSAGLLSFPTALAIGVPSDYNMALQGLDCSQALELISCCVTEATSLSDARCEIIADDDHEFFSQNSWHFEALRRQLQKDQWYSLELSDGIVHCHDCAPEKPRLRWKLGGDGDSIQPYEDLRSAAEYEWAIKRRPAAIVIEAQRPKNHQGTALQVRFSANLVSMAHRVRARLPDTIKELKLSWRVSTDFNPFSTFTFRPFKLRAVQDVSPYNGNLGMSVELFPNQRMSLSWMRQQEAGDGRGFIIEESEEERLDKLGWALETRAQASVHIRGGICADHPGYGKTILTLALMQSQCLDQSPATILSDLRERQKSRAPGLIPTTATLVICPRTLVEQWVQEAEEKSGLELGTDVCAIKNLNDLDRLTLDQIAGTKLVVFSSAVLRTDQYAERLAAFTGVPGPAAAKGRAFDQWLGNATKEVPGHLQILQHSGRDELREHVQAKYLRNLNSDEFKAVVPSRRLRGKDYVAAQNSKSKPSTTKVEASATLDTATVGLPLLEMFYWNRFVLDEYHNFESRELAIVQGSKKDKIWGLSGTPALGDSYDVAKMGQILHVHLPIGTETRGVMKLKNIREVRRERTDFELFDSMRVKPSEATLTRIHELDQRFLDTFVSRNVTDLKIDFEDHLVPVSLDLAHRALYTEVSQHLNSIEMRLKKGSKSKTTDRESRLYEAIASSETAEEALSKIAAYLDRDDISSRPGISSVETLLERRQEETMNCKTHILAAISEAEKGERVIFEQWRQGRVHLDVLGDEETLGAIKQCCSHSDQVSKTIAASKTKNGAKEDRSKGLTSTVNTLVNRLLVSIRSLRFVQNLRLVQLSAMNGVDEVRCDNPDCQSSSTKGDIALSAFCGHIVCRACYARMKDSVDAQCPADGCCATIKDHHLLWQSKMGDLRNPSSTTYGAKIDAAIKLLREIERKGDQAILFVQYESQLHEVSQALEEAQITAAVLDQPSTASRKIDAFKSPQEKITTIVLNASNETATGLNLQNANHVIFLSPLLRDQQYTYDATMAQAIGRVRRHGQKKQIHVYRIVALDTIDVDILEHRERRPTAITEYGAPKIDAPSASVQGHVKTEPTPERTQLVRQNGKFSLRPQSWLVRCGADSDEEELAQMQSCHDSDKVAAEQRVKMKGRVLGWEDFSSLIKFSRAYTEEDE
jgi:SNF2 family DNA or RNA helicase